MTFDIEINSIKSESSAFDQIDPNDFLIDATASNAPKPLNIPQEGKYSQEILSPLQSI